ncbi:hypothetical protein [Pseudonocardia sp. GCM10023141]|uniref:hypothetical protein n=1 Tax=Pseudonocardia sp. GCM10023141 TaxID=3252653 RepID=UPI00361060D2
MQKATPPPAEPPPAGPPPKGHRPRFDFRKLARTPRGAVGLGVLVAALLLWPFSGLSWIPWLAGLGALIVLRLLRLEGLLRGWDFAFAGIVVVIGLMLSTGPWAWALAASIGVLLAGLAQLPWWRLAAVGAVLCVVSGVGFGVSLQQTKAEEAKVFAEAGDAIRPQIAERRDDVLVAMLQAVDSQQPDPQPLCRLLAPAGLAQLLAATGSQTCTDSVTLMHDRLRSTPTVGPPAGKLPKPVSEEGDRRLVVDGCATPWAVAAGKALGRVHMEQTSPSVQTYVVVSFSPC